MGYKEPYLSALVAEMAMRRDYVGGETIDTIYFGGGTPSVLAASDFERVFEAIYRLFTVREDAEVTLEANPDDIRGAYVMSLLRLPFNRISMGVQSFSDKDLGFLNRRHTGREAREAILLCRAEGYDNISIDLIYGIPGQTPAIWDANLEEAIRLAPHISAYHLTYEKGTPLYRMREEKRVEEVGEEAALSLFERLTGRLSGAGYLQYEISNFAMPGYISRHNSAYWEDKKYLGLGPSAHSYDINGRQWNVASIQRYIRGIEKGQPEAESERLDADDKYNEYIMTRLRTCGGIDLEYILTIFGEHKLRYFNKQAQPFIDGQLLDKTAGGWKLSRQALFISDTVIRQLFWVDSYTKHGI
jgi:oxygen-independent coproporphyrinogen-3 oxidase